MDTQEDSAGTVTAVFAQSVLVAGAKLLAEEQRIFGDAEVLFRRELVALNRIGAVVSPEQLAGARLVTIGETIAAGHKNADILAHAVKVLGQLSQVTEIAKLDADMGKLAETVRMSGEVVGGGGGDGGRRPIMAVRDRTGTGG